MYICWTPAPETQAVIEEAEESSIASDEVE